MKGAFYGKKIKIGDRTFEQGKVYNDPRLTAFGKQPNTSGSIDENPKTETRHTIKRS